MPPKKTSSSTTLYLVFVGNSVDSVHASIETANERSADAKEKGKDDVRVEVQQLVGGSITVNAGEANSAKPAAKKAVKAEQEQDEASNEDDEDKPEAAPQKANTAAKKTKAPAEQRATNAAKPSKPDDDDQPDNIKVLLKGNGTQLEGLKIVVTGVPPSLGRKNAEKLVQLYGGSLTKSLSKNTSYVVVGNDAGPTKLDKIKELGIETWDEDELVAKIEAGGNVAKEEDGDEEEEKPKSKKRKTTKSS